MSEIEDLHQKIEKQFASNLVDAKVDALAIKSLTEAVATEKPPNANLLVELFSNHFSDKNGDKV